MVNKKLKFNKKSSPKALTLNKLYLLQLSISIILSNSAYAKDYFNPALLDLGTPGQSAADLTSFENKGGQMPGTYWVDIYLNNRKMDSRNVQFSLMEDSSGKKVLQPCIPVADLDKWGVLTKKYPNIAIKDAKCANLLAIPQASSNFLFSRQQLLLEFPQSSVQDSVRGWIDPKSWDEGITALLLNYNVSGDNSNTKGDGGRTGNNQYINIRPGFNIGAWRIRNYSTWARSSPAGKSSSESSQWDTIYTYAQRDILSLRAQLTLGDSSSPSDIFDSVPFRGVQLATDDDMLPDSQQGYAPIVRGIARTNAQVTIRQNGYIIYQTYVSPGSFEITDMYPTGGSGDLYITIKESDGSEQHSVIPFASLPLLQREGRLKYSITMGNYRSYDANVDKSSLAQATAIYGLPWGFTVYGGSQLANNYQSVALGQGKNLGDLGAISVDLTQAWSTVRNEKRVDGQSWRFRYSKDFADTGTNFAIAGYRYTTSGFRTIGDVLDTYGTDRNYDQNQRRNREEVTLNQRLLEGWGNLALTAIREDYWNTERQLSSYSLSYNNSYKGISYGINYTYNLNSTVSYNTNTDNVSSNSHIYNKDKIVSLNLSFPLSILSPKHPSYVNYTMNTSKEGNTTNNVNVGGSTLERNNLSWNVQEGYGSKGAGNTFGMNADWRATYGEVTGGYTQDKYNKRINYGLQGGMILHKDGLTLGQPLGETLALVAAPGAKNVGISNQTGVRTDYHGYGIVPYISPYRKNDIILDPQTLDDDTELGLTTQTVVPTRGAIVRANYKTSVGHRALMNLSRKDGSPVPFGATVEVENTENKESFIVGDGGQVYLTGLNDSGTVIAKWGSGAEESCAVDFTISNSVKGIAILNGVCR